MIEIIFGVIVGLVLLYLILALIGSIILVNVDQKYHLVIKLPKRKKYETKVDPIYELEDRSYAYDCDGDDYSIQKWSLKWNELECRFFLLIFVYPITVYTWGYSEDKHLHIGNRDHVERLYSYLSVNNLTLKDYYEREMDKLKKESDKVKLIEQEFKNKITIMNKEFTENFE